MIVTVTLNSAIDRIITVDRLAFENRAHINSSHESPGGRGINASCVIHSFGGRTLAVAVAGGEAGKRFVKHLEGCSFAVRIVPIRREIRTNLTITDKQGLTTNLNEAGPELTKTEILRFERAVRENMESAAWLMVCGSVPPGVPPGFYARLVELARRKKLPTLLHASGEALIEGIAAKPTLAVISQYAAERLLGRALLSQAQFLDAARQLRAKGPQSVVITLGSRGAVAAFPEGLVEALPPSVHSVCPIGAGDALMAAYTWAIQRSKNACDALRWGVAAGTASARLPGLHFANLHQTREIYEQVEVRRAE